MDHFESSPAQRFIYNHMRMAEWQIQRNPVKMYSKNAVIMK